MCVYGVVLINILVLQFGPPKQKFLAPPLLVSNDDPQVRALLFSKKGTVEVDFKGNQIRWFPSGSPPQPTRKWWRLHSFIFCISILSQLIELVERVVGLLGSHLVPLIPNRPHSENKQNRVPLVLKHPCHELAEAGKSLLVSKTPCIVQPLNAIQLFATLNHMHNIFIIFLAAIT